MTRIVSGRAGGRRLRVPGAGTRPTSDRVREAAFNLVAARVEFDGMRVLDLYAGSGALGLEALSRGAAHALFVESDRAAASVVRENIATLGLAGAELRVGTVGSVLSAGPRVPYDVVFSDPPYALDGADVAADLTALTVNGWLRGDALVLVERPVRLPEIDWPAPFSVSRSRRYGETRVELAEYEPSAPG